jgi:AraC family transcriptional regulator
MAKAKIKMEPRIEKLKEKKLIGKRINMSFANNKTTELWRSFMPRRKEIKNYIGQDLYSIEIYNPDFFLRFNPESVFEKWAAIQVSDFDGLPDDMETVTIPPGLYAVFIHKGPAGKGRDTYQYIFTEWLPNADFIVDHRPHFALMGEKYKKDDPHSEEEIWIPIKA